LSSIVVTTPRFNSNDPSAVSLGLSGYGMKALPSWPGTTVLRGKFHVNW
jgi:hypothetical protein